MAKINHPSIYAYHPQVKYQADKLTFDRMRAICTDSVNGKNTVKLDKDEQADFNTIARQALMNPSFSLIQVIEYIDASRSSDNYNADELFYININNYVSKMSTPSIKVTDKAKPKMKETEVKPAPKKDAELQEQE